MKRHIIFAHRLTEDHSCYICKRVYNGRRTLLKHFRHLHSELLSSNSLIKTAKLECNTCGKIFEQSHGLQLHIERVHKDLKGFECNKCQKKFVGHQGLQRHINYAHLKKYQCKQCGKGFGGEKEFKYHVCKAHDKHSDNELDTVQKDRRSFKCRSCPKRYSEQRSLNRHVKQVHLNLKKKPSRKVFVKSVKKDSQL